MQIKIKRLEIISFRGIKCLELNLDGADAILSGRNGTGKSSAYNAFLWLLFGKDSDGARPDVKPLDSHSNRVSGVDTEVTATLLVDGAMVTLRKVLHEQWRKVAGSAEPIYVADETLCWVDDVPKKVDKEYLPYVLSLLGGDEGIFRLLTDTNAFMRLHWNDRRKELMKMVGVDVDGKLMQEARFAPLASVLGGSTTEDARKRLMEQRKRYSEQLKGIPARLDELRRTMEPLAPEQVTQAQAEIAELEAQLAAIDGELAGYTGADARFRELISQSAAAVAAMEKVKRDAHAKVAVAVQDAENHLRDLAREGRNLEADLDRIRAGISQRQEDLEALEGQRQGLLDQYHDLDDLQYTPPEAETTCPCCGQSLPQERLEDAARQHAAKWSEDKALQKKAIIDQGNRVKGLMATCQEKITVLLASRDAAQASLAELEPAMDAAKKQLAEARALTPEYETLPDYVSAKAAYEEAEKALKMMGTQEATKELRMQKLTILAAIEDTRVILARAEQSAKVQARLEELEAERRKVGDLLMELEGTLALLGEYVSARCAALEEDINAHFRVIQWRLFEEDKQGGVHDCCRATVGGISYEAGLNSSAKTNAGIEIIRALSAAYGVSVPCFVDNSETINTVGQTGGQMILLKVTEEPQLTLTILD